MTIDGHSSFYKIYINFLYGKHPVIIGVQRSDQTSLFIGMIEEDLNIKELIYSDDLLRGEYVDSDVFGSALCLLDSNMAMKVINLPVENQIKLI